MLEGGAHAVIASSALFRDGAVDVAFAEALAMAVGREHVIAAVDSKGGRVAIHGWKTVLPITAVDAVKALEPYCDEFLYTHVDKEGLMQGTDMDAILAVRARHQPARHGGRRHHDVGRDRRPGRRGRGRRRRAWRCTRASCRSTAEPAGEHVRSGPEPGARYCVTLGNVIITLFYVTDAEPLRIRRDRP